MNKQISNFSGASRVELAGIQKSYGDVKVVRDMNLEVGPGEFLVLLGPSGCGKSTALRMLAGLETSDVGTITIGDRDVTKVLPKYRDIAMVFQSYALYPHKTVAENIGFPLKMRKMSQSEIDERVMHAAKQVHLEDFLARYPKQLSGGQRQRVALARAIVRKPEVFLMDEPLSNLDAKLRGFMRAELKHMQHELGVTTIYVTHDQIEAMTLASRIAIMNHGIIQQIGTPKEVYNTPANMFVAGFLGSPPMNFVEGTLNGGRFSLSGSDHALAGPERDGLAVMGFRPEDSEIVGVEEGDFQGRVFAVEMTGDMTLVTLEIGKDHATVKMPSSFEADFDDTVGVKISPDKLHFFVNDEEGARIPYEPKTD